MKTPSFTVLNKIASSQYLSDSATLNPADAYRSKVAKQISKIKEPVPRYFESINQINNYWSEGEYDLMEIFKLLKFEAYFFKATQKKLSLLTKSGFEIHSDNDEIKEYLDARFSLMELQTGFSIKGLLEEIAFYLIVCSNAFLIKVRDENFQYASSYKIDNKDMYPVSGLFIAHPTSIKPRYKWVRFKDGVQVRHKLELAAWVYVNKRGVIATFEPEDVVHFTLYKEYGMTLGTPEVISVIDDIRTLRKMEEDVQLLLYRDLFPILHYSVEEPAMVDHASGTTELDMAKRDLEKMMQDGGIATDARHKINYIGAQGKHIEVRPYLEYFQNRVFSGLGISATDLGIGKDISGNTAQSMSKQLLDSSRFIQQELTRQFDEFILKEMMLQSPFGVNGLRKENRPSLRFEEIDIEWKIRTENHAADQFTKGALTIDEVRNQRGMKTLSDEHLKRTYHHMYGDGNPDAVRERDAKIRKLETSASKDLIKSSSTNSNVTKSSRTKRKDSVMQDFILDKDIALQLVDIVDRYKENHPIGAKFNIKLATASIYDVVKKNALWKFNEGMQDAAADLKAEMCDDDKLLKRTLIPIFDSITELSKVVCNELGDDIIKNTPRALRRIDSANKTEQVKAYNLGYALVARDAGVTTFDTYHYDSDDRIDTLETRMLSDVFPKHPNSKTIIRAIKQTDSVIDKVEIPEVIITDTHNPLEDKLSDALSYISELKDTVTSLRTQILSNDKEDPTVLLDKINANTNEQIKMFLGTIEELKDQNTSISGKYIDAIGKILKNMDEVSKDNIDSIKAIADSIPKNITVTSSPIEVRVDNPPMEVNLTLEQSEQKAITKKKINVIRDSKGQILSAEVEEE